jgi:hypothetical protein
MSWFSKHQMLADAVTTDVRDSEDRMDRIVVAANAANPILGSKVRPWVDQWVADEPEDPTG